MRIKSYFAQSVHEAMQKARIELGPDALLLSSKKATEPSAASAYEVVFGLSNDNVPERPAETARTEPSVSEQLAELRQQLESMQRSIVTPVTPPAASYGPCVMPGVVERLVAAGFSRALAMELTQSAQTRVPSAQPPLPEAQPRPKRRGRPPGSGRKKSSPAQDTDCSIEGILDEVESRFTVSPGLTSLTDNQQVILFVGPPGAGKTTTLVKLAVNYGTLRRAPVHIISTDTLRLGGAEQLDAYARILGVGFQAMGGRAALEQALEECRSKKLVLIDSPGFGPADMEETAELAAFAQQRRGLQVQLVLPATLNHSAMSRTLQRFEQFRPGKLLFSHVDEMESPACLIETAIRSKLPISFLANGQQIPDHLAEASKRDLRLALAAHLNRDLSPAV